MRVVLRRRFTLIVWVLLISLVLAACTEKSGTPTNDGGVLTETQPPAPESLPTMPALAAGKSGITGVIRNENGPIGPGVRIYFTPVTRHPDGWAVFVLDTNTTEFAPVDASGLFQGVNLEPGEYVLVVGDNPETAVAISGEDGQARIYAVEPDQLLDIGTESLALAVVPNFPTPTPLPYPGLDTGQSYP